MPKLAQEIEGKINMPKNRFDEDVSEESQQFAAAVLNQLHFIRNRFLAHRDDPGLYIAEWIIRCVFGMEVEGCEDWTDYRKLDEK